MQKNRTFALALTLLSAALGQARAEEPVPAASPGDEGVTTVDAQRLEIFLDRKMSAIGDAELHRDGEAIFGDRIDYDMLNEELHVVGNTRVEQGGNVITGPELRLKLEERLGEMKEPVFTLYHARIAAPMEPGGAPARVASRGDARLLTFDGPDREHLKDARYTTCPAGVDDWFLRAKELELDHHTETGTATHASIEFKGVPILYTPWIDFPFKNQRKSGFLTPNWSTSTRSGFDVSLPYYWNIAPNMDATITPRYISKRGEQLQGEFRYLEADYSGEDRLEFLPNDNASGDSRFYAQVRHRHNFGHGLSGDLSFERVSDNQYFSDMTTHIITTSRVNLPQQGSLNYTFGSWNLNALAQQFQTLDGISFPYQRLPQLTLTGARDWDVAIGNLYSQWVRFDRNSQAPASQPAPSAPGASLITGVTGNRATLYPSISIPLGRSYGYVTPKFGVHYTQYDLDNTAFTLTDTLGNTTSGNFESGNRTLPIFSVDSGMYFDRDFRVVKNAYTQTLEPRLYYVYIPHQDQSRLPVFDTGVADLNMSTLFSENQFVGGDRVNDANQVSLAVTTRFLDSRTGIQRLAATIGQRFYFGDQRVTLPGGQPRTSHSSDIVAGLTARLLTHWNLDAGWQFNTDQDQTVKANVSTRYQPEPGKVLNLSYRYTRDFVEQIDASSEWPLGGRWFGLGRINYSFLDNPQTPGREKGMIESLAGVEYDGGCWQARGVMQRVSLATATANYAFFFQLELGGLASVGQSPLSLLKRSIPGYSSTDLVPDNFQP